MPLGSDLVHFALFTQRKHAAALSDEAPAKCFTAGRLLLNQLTGFCPSFYLLLTVLFHTLKRALM